MTISNLKSFFTKRTNLAATWLVSTSILRRDYSRRCATRSSHRAGWGSFDAQAVGEAAEAPALVFVAHRLDQRAAGADQHADPLGARDRGIDEVAPQHQEVALMHRDDDGG